MKNDIKPRVRDTFIRSSLGESVYLCLAYKNEALSQTLVHSLLGYTLFFIRNRFIRNLHVESRNI